MQQANYQFELLETAVNILMANDYGYDPEDMFTVLTNLVETLEELTTQAGAALSDHQDDYEAYMADLEQGGIYG